MCHVYCFFPNVLGCPCAFFIVFVSRCWTPYVVVLYVYIYIYIIQYDTLCYIILNFLYHNSYIILYIILYYTTSYYIMLCFRSYLYLYLYVFCICIYIYIHLDLYLNHIILYALYCINLYAVICDVELFMLCYLLS